MHKLSFLSGNVEMVQLMIASGAQLEAYDVHFGPPLHIACAKGHVDCVKEMLNAGQKMCSRIYLSLKGVLNPISKYIYLNLIKIYLN